MRKAERKVQSFANKAVFFQATNGGQKKDKSLFLDPNKKLKLRMACGLEKDVRGSEKREAAFPGPAAATGFHFGQGFPSPHNKFASGGNCVNWPCLKSESEILSHILENFSSALLCDQLRKQA